MAISVRQVATANAGATTTISPTLSSAAVAGNVLIAIHAQQNWQNDTTFDEIAGYGTVISSGPATGNGNLGWLVVAKIAAGGETSVTAPADSGQGNHTAALIEIEGFTGTAKFDAIAEDVSNRATVTDEQSSGTATATAAGFAVAIFIADAHTSVDADRAYTNGFSEVLSAPGNTRPGIMVATKAVAAGNVETTFSTSEGDEMVGCIVVLVDDTGGSEEITGSGSPSEAADTSSAAGILGRHGSGTPSEAADTSSASGVIGHTGSGTPSEAADTSSASGVLGHTGSGSPSEAADTASASGVIGHKGSGTPTEAADTCAGEGTVTSDQIIGSGSPAEAADTSSGTGILGHKGSGSPSEATDTSAGTGKLGHVGSGTPSEADDSASGSGQVGEVVEFPQPQGGHYWPDVEYDDFKERSAKERRLLLRRLIEGAENAPEPVREEIKVAIAPYQKKGATGFSVSQKGIARLANNLAAVERLIAAYQEYLDDEDATVLLLVA